MKKRRKQPSGGSALTENLLIRLSALEKQAFRKASELAGQSLSVWVRDRLRNVASAELTKHGQAIPFMPEASN